MPSKNRPLTGRQAEILAAVQALSKDGAGPTLHELCERTGLRSTWSLRRHLSILERKGLLKPRRFRKPRDIALLPSANALAA
jgi:SOS-response transcriptional repressor LexA